MKIKVFDKLFVFIIACTISFCLIGQSYVTYQLPYGRLGDKLITYVHAKWISYKYGLKLLYRPFEYSDKLMLSKIEQPFGFRKNFSSYICPKRAVNTIILTSIMSFLRFVIFRNAKEVRKT